MIGDRLDTDIQFGKNGGISTLLVLTGAALCLSPFSSNAPNSHFCLISGVTSAEQVTPEHANYMKETVPDYVLQGLGDLQVLLEA
jgi:HAD-hyrolase-like